MTLFPGLIDLHFLYVLPLTCHFLSLSQAKGRGVKLQKVQITISSKFLRLVDAAKMV